MTTEDVSVVNRSKRPKDSKFKQQALPAWQPILTAGTVLPTFFVIGRTSNVTYYILSAYRRTSVPDPLGCGPSGSGSGAFFTPRSGMVNNPRLRIRIGSGFNRVSRIRNPDPDPGGQKWPTEVNKNIMSWSVGWLFWELKASSVTWTFFMEA